MTWTFNPVTSRTDGTEEALLRRVEIDEAIQRLTTAGITNRFELTRIVCALSRLPAAEVRFTVDLLGDFERERMAGA